MAFDVLLSTVFKLEFFFSCNIKIPRTFFFNKNLIVLHHGDDNFLFWHLYEIHTFNNNLNDEEMIVWCNFFMIKMLQLLPYKILLSKKKAFRHSKI